MARLRRRIHRPDQRSGRDDQAQSQLPTYHCQRLECSRFKEYESASLPCLLPVLRGRRPAEPATLPAQRGYISRSPVQYRIVCTAATNDGAGDRTESG